MTSSYGHANGVNVQNYRIISERQNKPGALDYRSPFTHREEAAAHVAMSQTQNIMSSSLRHSSNLVKAAADEQVQQDISTVEAALKAKLKHTEMLKNALGVTITDTMSEIEQCALLRASLEQRLGRVQEKEALNESRLKVRAGRPMREKTMDDVEGVLLQQQGLVGSFAERVRRASGHLDREMQQLDYMRVRLEADMRDKIDAIDVDTKVLAVQPDGTAGEASLLRRKADLTMRTPSSWVASTEDNIRNARKWISDSARLRKAIRHAVLGARAAEHELARTLNGHMLSKIAETKGLKGALEKQLAQVQGEIVSAHSQRESLAQALESKRGPLQQAKERLQARKARPDREMVHDDVELALVKEIAHLNAITSQLANKLTSVDKTIAGLDLAALTLEDNIRDKDTTLAMDERMALLDGRINLNTAPPSSIGTLASGSAMSEVREATMRRINDLEAELASARQERQALESSIVNLKETLGRGVGSPRSPLSP